MRHLALKNLKGRKAYSAIIIAAVTAAVVMTLFSLFVTGGVRQEVENSRRLLGPDLAVVPKGNKEKGHIYLSKGPPAQGSVPAGILEQLGNFPELEAVTPQKRLGAVVVGPVQASIIGFDPSTDFFVHPWLDRRNTARFPGRDAGYVLGAQVRADGLPEVLPGVDGTSAVTGGCLRKTGTFMDTAIFIPRQRAEIAAEPAWILLRLRQGASLDITSNRLEVNLDQIEVLRRPEMFKTINDQLYWIVDGGGFGVSALLTIIGAFLVTGAMFAVMAQERKREFGLLKAMGATNTFVFKLIMGEAALLGSIGAALGIGMAAICLLCVHAGIIPQAIPPVPFSIASALRDMLIALALAVVIAVLSALFPALGAICLEPYAAIRSGE